MRLAAWWCSRSDASTAPAPKRSFVDSIKRRVKREAHYVSKEDVLLGGSYRLSLNCDRLSASVSQAKDLLQQCAAVVSLYPPLVSLSVPSVLSPRKNKDTGKRESVVTAGGTRAASPVKNQRATLHQNICVESEALLAFEARVHSLMDSSALQLHLTSDGCGGAYIIQDGCSNNSVSSVHGSVGIFKPRDEEYMASKNPRGYVKENAVVGVTEHPVNKGFRVGNGALRERAAFLLDEAYGGFSGVPTTSVMELPVDGVMKEGSVQEFVESECSAEDMGSLKFSVPEVHKIGILDVRLFNTDRHAGNILLHRQNQHEPSSTAHAHDQTYGMTPIDHGFCLPTYQHLDNANFDWLQWSQAQYPFTGEELNHIASLDVAQDARILRSLGFDEACITTMRICTKLLQMGAEEGFSLYEIGRYLQREGDFSEPSTLEQVIARSMVAVKAKGNFCDEDSREFMDALVEEATIELEAMLAEQPKKKVRSMSCFS